MKSCCDTSLKPAEVARARPLLGTFVEIRASGAASATLDAAVDRAFAQIARVHQLMSPNDPESDVARLNAGPLGRRVRVHGWTWRVLAAARALHAASAGVFDITVDPRCRARFLAVAASAARPATAAIRSPVDRAIAGGVAARSASVRPAKASPFPLEFLPNGRIRRLAPVRIDLGGIAKGFAVDRAIAALRSAGVGAGSVNAGGDLRVFGPDAEPVWVRHPAAPNRLVPLAVVANRALATSANTLDPRGGGRLRRPAGGRLWIGRGSVSIQARTCLAADALTKVVAAVGPRRAAGLLRRYRATALAITAAGRIVTSPPREPRHAA